MKIGSRLREKSTKYVWRVVYIDSKKHICCVVRENHAHAKAKIIDYYNSYNSNNSVIFFEDNTNNIFTEIKGEYINITRNKITGSHEIHKFTYLEDSLDYNHGDNEEIILTGLFVDKGDK